MSENQPLHQTIYEELSARVRSGLWRTGQRVPSEKSLIAEFSAPRQIVRQALAALRADGVITGGRGAPPRVQRGVPMQSFGTYLSFTDWATQSGFTPGQQLVERTTRPATETLARELCVHPDDTVVEVVRLRTLDGDPALFERAWFPAPVGSQLLAAPSPGESMTRELSRIGAAPSRARHIIDAVAAHPLDAEWLRVSPGSPLLRSRRTTLTADGSVVEYADDRYLPTMTTFAIENAAAARARTASLRGEWQPRV